MVHQIGPGASFISILISWWIKTFNVLIKLGSFHYFSLKYQSGEIQSAIWWDSRSLPWQAEGGGPHSPAAPLSSSLLFNTLTLMAHTPCGFFGRCVSFTVKAHEVDAWTATTEVAVDDWISTLFRELPQPKDLQRSLLDPNCQYG